MGGDARGGLPGDFAHAPEAADVVHQLQRDQRLAQPADDRDEGIEIARHHIDRLGQQLEGGRVCRLLVQLGELVPQPGERLHQSGDVVFGRAEGFLQPAPERREELLGAELARFDQLGQFARRQPEALGGNGGGTRK